MVYGSCPMYGGGFGGSIYFYINVIIAAALFSLIFWGAYYLLIKKIEVKQKKK